MTIYFSVDRSGFYQENTKYNLTPILESNIASPTAQLFHSGISQHGIKYFTGSNGEYFNIYNQFNHASPTIEYSLELFRQQYYPSKPSRFSSMFGWSTLCEAKHFRGWAKCPLSTPIYEIISDEECHKGDMNILNSACSMAEFECRLNTYWSGESYSLSDNYEPLWEIVIPMPVSVGSKIS